MNAAISPYTLPIERFLRIGTYKRRKHLTTQFRKAELHSFLLGDAAHSHSSFEASIEWWYYGCRGFAVDLTWKLALSYKGQASQRLLDTYEERREWYKEHMKLDKMLDKTIKIRVGDPEGSKGFSDLDMANGYISGLGARYSAVVQTRGNNLPFLDLKKDILTSGKRFPSLTLRRHLDGSKVDTLDELRLDGKFKVLVFVGHILESTVFANLSTCLLKWLANDSEKGLDQEKIVDFFLIHSGSRFYIMMFDFLQPFSEYAANIFEDENDTMHGFLGVNVNYGAICLLRPDGHVLVVGSLDDGLLVQEQLAKYLDM